MKRFIFYLIILTAWSLYFFFDIHKTYASEKEHYYIGAYGGFQQFDKSSHTYYNHNNWAASNAGVRTFYFDDGWRAGVFFGKRFNKTFGADIEYTFLTANQSYMIDDWRGPSIALSDPNQVGKQSIHALLLNGKYHFDIPFFDDVYAGLGLGAMYMTLNSRKSAVYTSGTFQSKGYQLSPAGQFSTGFSYDLPSDKKAGIEKGDVSLGFSYKYLRMLANGFYTKAIGGGYNYDWKRKPIASHFFGLQVLYKFKGL